jgi:type I restriction enzyme, S subunit
MMMAAQYGHIIKHLETAHLEALPIPLLRDDHLAEFHNRTRKILDLRIKAFEKSKEAEQLFAAALPSLKPIVTPRTGFTIKASAMFGARRRLDASRFVPSVDRVVEAFQRDAKRVDLLSDVASSVFVPGRFKHIYGDGGMPYLDSADILEVNPDITKFVLSLSTEEQKEYHVEPGWLLIPCSGQVYGNIGHTVLATEYHVGKVLTNHILRVCPNDRIRSGYLQCVLGHPELGRPRLVRFAFGSSVPEIASVDVQTVPVPRFDSGFENELADLAEASAVARDEADDLEQQLGAEAETLIDAFLAGDTTAFAVA